MTTYENARPVRKGKGGPVLLLVVLLIVATALGAGVTYLTTKPSEQSKIDRCTAQGVRTYPTVDEMKVADLDACQDLTDQQLTEVRKALQDFALQGAVKIGEKLEEQPLDPRGAGEATGSPSPTQRSER